MTTERPNASIAAQADGEAIFELGITSMEKNTIRMSVSKIIAAFGVVVLMFSNANAELRFELENPFRFFRHSSDYAVQKIAFDLALWDANAGRKSEPVKRDAISIEEFEKRLQSRDHWLRPITQEQRTSLRWPLAWKGGTPLEIIEGLRKSEKRPDTQDIVGSDVPFLYMIERFGWASLLDTQAPDAEDSGVCWNRVDLNHTKNCPRYIAPRSWTVRIFDDEAPSDGICTWKLNSGARFRSNNTEEASASCNEVYISLIIQETAEGAGPVPPRGRTVITRQRPSGEPSRLDIEVVDHLFVGIGDSYSSGEGNPDRPVVFSPNLSAAGGVLPRRPSNSPIWAAQWIDRSCHRSAYSWQLRAALHQTLIDPTRAVTFLSYACSGAEVIEGLLYPWKGPERSSALPSNRPQLAAIYEELCWTPTRIESGSIPAREQDSYLSELDDDADFPWNSKEQELGDRFTKLLKCSKGGSLRRPIDTLVFSIGGNDVGFARWIAGAILEGRLRDIAEGFIPKKEGCIDDDDACQLAAARTARLKSRLVILRRLLVDRLAKDARLPLKNIFVAGYPKALNNDEGLLCATGNGGMTLGRGDGPFAIRNQGDLKAIEYFRAEVLTKFLNDFVSGSSSKLTPVDRHVDQFIGHGFCATKNVSEKTKNLFTTKDLRELELGGETASDTLHFPRIGKSRTRDDGSIDENPWRPFNPADWHAYATRTRWLRTLNDVFLTVNNKSSDTLEEATFGFLDLNGRPISGAFHPTALGHAVIADAMLAAQLQSRGP